MFFVTGLGLAADSIEILAIAYILPSAEQDLCMDSSQKGWLGGISFVGMMIGGLVWGSLADKIGRRRTLLSSLTTNAVFSIITAFMPTYGLFMVTRLCSGIGALWTCAKSMRRGLAAPSSLSYLQVMLHYLSGRVLHLLIKTASYVEPFYLFRKASGGSCYSLNGWNN
ncbi:synaptic vesicle glycoprotein 2C-like [Tachypleus tridentatus]|uniref:synaptic vesicle glycoprotein 2C-like n=1 Tax=Tachypleus tridentatus TaxID=6853 RepID=UPI003FD57AB4